MKTEKEICELLREEKNKNGLNSKYYIKIDSRVRSSVVEEDIGKLKSEVYPSFAADMTNISKYTSALIYDRESEEYKNYFNLGYKPFIVEVWERTDNVMKLIYKRNNENEDFEEI